MLHRWCVAKECSTCGKAAAAHTSQIKLRQRADARSNNSQAAAGASFEPLRRLIQHDLSSQTETNLSL